MGRTVNMMKRILLSRHLLSLGLQTGRMNFLLLPLTHHLVFETST